MRAHAFRSERLWNHKRRLAGLGLLLLGCAIAPACGSDDVATNDGGGAGDAASDIGPDIGSDVGSDADAASGGTLGATCTQDADCVAGLSCWHDDGGGAQFPAHGLCTVSCNDDETKCDKIVPGATCRNSGSSVKRCFEPCKRGTPAFESLTSGMPAGKCHGRNDMACLSGYDGTNDFCYPVCNDDSACTNAKCSPFSALCTAGAVEGWEDIGKLSQPNTPCSTKVASGTTPGFCTAACTIGVAPSCTWAGPGTVAKAACMLGSSSPGQGDKGFCALLCDCDADCPTLKCNPIPATMPPVLGRKGVCGTGPDGIACEDAGSDAGGASDAADAGDAAGD